MPDISAFSLQSALTPGLAAPLENAGIPAEPGAGTSPVSFDALLALQAAAQTASPEAAAAFLPESGKTLPDAAIAVAALAQPSAQTNAPQAVLLKAHVARPASTTATAEMADADPLADLTAESIASSDGAAEVAPQPDIALFAAIFAAPDRLAAPAPQAEPTGAAPAPMAAPATPATGSTPATPPAVAVAVAIASTAQIELAPATRTGTVPVAASASGIPVEEQPPAAIMPAVATTITPTVTTQAARTVPADSNAEPASNEAAPRKLAAPEAAKPQLAESIASAEIPAAILAEAPVQADVQPASTTARGEAKAERIDFATLVDTLARAREEASPRTVNVAVTNTDFGRVSLRFDSNDNGLAVAMSAADPGFARAVSASADAAATSADTRNPNQQAQNDARAQASDASAQRQQSGQQQQGQSQQPRTDARFTASTQASTRRDNDADSGIYA